MSPLVSIVVPSYNHGLFIQECIQSIIDQDYQNIELIIIDDGSSDDSVQKIEEMAAACQNRFARFEFRSRPNKGLCVTLNEALEWCVGDFFSTIASDDILFPQKTSKQVLFLRSHPKVCGVFSGANIIDSKGNFMYKIIPNNRELSFKNIFLSNYTILAPTQMLRMKALKKLGNDIYPANIKIEDWYMWLRITKAGLLKNMPDILAKYRQHDHNTMKNTELIYTAQLEVLHFYNNDPLYPQALIQLKLTNYLQNDDYKKVIKIIKEEPSILMNKLFYKKIIISIMLKARNRFLTFRRKRL